MLHEANDMANAVLKYQRELAEWKAQGKAIIDAAEADDRDLTEAEAADIKEIESEIERSQSRLDRALKAQAWEREEAEVVETPAEAVPTESVPARARDNTPPKLFANFGEQLLAIRSAGEGMGTDPRLLEIGAAATGAGTSNPSEGGFLVQTDFAQEILEKMHSTGELLSRVRRFSISSNADGMKINAIKETSRATGSRYGGVQAYFVDQGTAPTNTTVSLRQIELKLNKVGALGYATDELMEDAASYGSLMAQAFLDEIQFATENTVFRGTGAGQGLGFLAHACAIDVAAETGQAATTIEYANIVNMWARMWAPSRRNAVWLINQDIEPQLFQMSMDVGTGGVPVYLPANGAASSPYGTLMGRPVIPVEYASTLGTSGDISLVDLGEVLFCDKGGVAAAQSMHVRFIQGEQTFRAFYRYDCQPGWESALTPFQGSNTKSPFITLATRS